MKKIAEVEIRNFTVDVYKGYDKDIAVTLPGNFPGDQAKLFFFFITTGQQEQWERHIPNMLGIVVDNFDGITEEYSKSVLKSICDTDYRILSNSLYK